MKTDYETTSKMAYHIMEKDGCYIVYNPKLVKKGKFDSFRSAYKETCKLNEFSRLPIYSQDSRGVVNEIYYPEYVKVLKSTDTEKIDKRRNKRKIRVLHA